MAVQRADGASYDALAAGESFTGKLMYAAHMDTDGDLVLAGAGELVYGIVTEEADNAGDPVTVQTAGIAKCSAGAAITAGVEVAAAADGQIITASGAGTKVLGIARNSVSNADEIVEVLIDRGVLHA